MIFKKVAPIRCQDLAISMKKFRGGGRLKYSGLVRERAVESTENDAE